MQKLCRGLVFPCHVLLLAICLIDNSAIAQISPPGLDDTHVVLFGAVAINQPISEKWFNQSYVAGSRFSDPNNNHILKKQAIFVIDQQMYRQFGKHWQLAFCLSYRNQDQYADEPPYDYDIPSSRREMR